MMQAEKICPSTFSHNNWARWYDFKDRISDTKVRGQWIFNAGKWWYEHEDGSYTKDGWEKINGYSYLFDDQGWMLYDWKKKENDWYFLGNDNDVARQFGWLFQNKKWYYLGEPKDGVMKTGWQKIESKWYYFNEEGIMQTGWIKDNGKDYCFYSDGSMIHDCRLYGYSYDSNGVAVRVD